MGVPCLKIVGAKNLACRGDFFSTCKWGFSLRPRVCFPLRQVKRKLSHKSDKWMLIKLRLLKVPANKQIIVPALKRNTAEMDSTQWTTFPYTYSVLLTSDSVADIWPYTSLPLATPHSRLNIVYVCMCVCMYDDMKITLLKSSRTKRNQSLIRPLQISWSFWKWYFLVSSVQ